MHMFRNQTIEKAKNSNDGYDPDEVKAACIEAERAVAEASPQKELSLIEWFNMTQDEHFERLKQIKDLESVRRMQNRISHYGAPVASIKDPRFSVAGMIAATHSVTVA